MFKHVMRGERMRKHIYWPHTYVPGRIWSRRHMIGFSFWDVDFFFGDFFVYLFLSLDSHSFF